MFEYMMTKITDEIYLIGRVWALPWVSVVYANVENLVTIWRREIV